MFLRFLAIIMLFSLTLNACSNSAKQALGLNRKAPDEFTVISRAPLTIPPVFNMRPPKPGEVRPQEGTTLDAAKEALVSSSANLEKNVITKNNAHLTPSSGEEALLNKAAVANASSDIRKVIDQEALSLVKESTSFVDKLVFWREPEDPTLVEVDPVLESKRIQENTALGKEITTGETPIIERGRKGIFEK